MNPPSSLRLLVACAVFAAAAVIGWAAPPMAAEEIWEMSWDDAADGALAPGLKSATAALTIVQDRVNGAFLGEVCGTRRSAIFTGERTEYDAAPLLVLQQREPGYTCAYQLQGLAAGLFRGVWHDTRGRSGDVLLRRLGAAR